jgi:hypothetical protein
MNQDYLLITENKDGDIRHEFFDNEEEFLEALDFFKRNRAIIFAAQITVVKDYVD